MDRTASEENMMAGVWALLLVVAVACLGGFVLTAFAGWLSMTALTFIGAPQAGHWVAASALVVVTTAIAYGRTGMNKAR